MAGSYGHIADDKTGKFIGVELIDNLGDAYEALEECFGMIWFLADGDASKVEEAWKRWEDGIAMSPGVAEGD